MNGPSWKYVFLIRLLVKYEGSGLLELSCDVLCLGVPFYSARLLRLWVIDTYMSHQRNSFSSVLGIQTFSSGWSLIYLYLSMIFILEVSEFLKTSRLLSKDIQRFLSTFWHFPNIHVLLNAYFWDSFCHLLSLTKHNVISTFPPENQRIERVNCAHILALVWV